MLLSEKGYLLVWLVCRIDLSSEDNFYWHLFFFLGANFRGLVFVCDTIFPNIIKSTTNTKRPLSKAMCSAQQRTGAVLVQL